MQINGIEFTLGTDPEIFLYDTEKKMYVSAHDLLPGTKHAPHKLDKGAVQVDGLAVEFNTDPAHTAEEFKDNIFTVLKQVRKMVDPKYAFSFRPRVFFPKKYFDALPDHVKVLGCDPDYNAWTKTRNPRPKATDATLRSCGGHIHVGYEKDKIDPTSVVKMMDLYLGVPSILMDKGEVRKQLYGGPGAYRDKPYGVEYRTLSNFWIFQNRLIEWVWDNTSRAVAAAEQFTLSEEDGESIVNAIKNNDKELATQLVKKFNLEVVHV